MRFHTTHLFVLIAVIAFVLGVIRHPEALWAAVVPLVAGLFVVLPVLGLVELFTPVSKGESDLSWIGAIAASAVALIGAIAGFVVLAILLQAMN